MITEIDYDFYNKYPRIYAIAETYGFSQRDISKMINILNNDSFSCKVYGTSKETVLRMILARSGLNRNDFYDKLNCFRFETYEDIHDIEKYIGKYCVIAYTMLLMNKNELH